MVDGKKLDRQLRSAHGHLPVESGTQGWERDCYLQVEIDIDLRPLLPELSVRAISRNFSLSSSVHVGFGRALERDFERAPVKKNAYRLLGAVQRRTAQSVKVSAEVA